MIRSFKDAPIKSKLNVVVMLTSCTVLLLLTIVYGIYDIARFKADMAEDLLIISRTIGMNSTASLMFNDADDARETLSSLSSDKHINFAMIINMDRSIFAYYSRNEQKSAGDGISETAYDHIRDDIGRTDDTAHSYHFSKDELEVVSDIYLDNDKIGEVVIWKDLVELNALIYNYVIMSAVILVVFLFLAYAISSKLQVLISGPIIKLNNVMKEVSEQGNFTLRAEKESDDEIGALIEGFNKMLSQIQVRDEKLMRHGDMLEKEVAKRTKQLESTNNYLEKAVVELLEAKSAAEAASKAKSQFLANVSHEIRTPMHGVLGMTELLISTGLNPSQKRLAETVNKSGKSLLNIINDILDFSKIEAGKLSLDNAEFNLYQAVEEVVDIYSTESFGKGVEIIHNIHSDVPEHIVGDVNRLSQILSNLINNAVKFTSEGEISISVELKRMFDDSPVDTRREAEILCTVSDTGIGVPSEFLGTIFESFTQVDGSLSRRYGGTGLGLTIVKQLVELMGGEVGIESGADKGTKVWFTFRSVVVNKGRSLEDVAKVDLEHVKVLAVDDNFTNRHYLQQIFDNWGLKIGLAGSGPEALNMLNASAYAGEPYDIALLDVMMPGMDGMELATRIKQDPLLSSTELIILSSAGLDEKRDMSSVACCILPKPVRQSQLYSCIATLLLSTSKVAATGFVKDSGTDSNTLPSGLSILVAEDNPVNQLVAEQMLDSLGCAVHVVDNGQDVLDALRFKEYDIIFMDCQMPKMDGFEATAKIREAEEKGAYLKHNKIVALTAHAMKSDKVKCLDAGMDGYLSKPFSKGDMISSINEALFGNNGDGRDGDGLDIAREYMDDELVMGAGVADGVQNAATGQYVPIDESYLKPLRKLDMENHGGLLDKIASTYIDSSDVLTKSLVAAVEAGDHDGILKAAHSLKSASHQVGAVRLAGMSKTLEFMGRDRELSGSRELLDDMMSEYAAVVRYLTSIANGGGNGQIIQHRE